MSQVIPIERAMGLSERFWSLAKGMNRASRDGDPVACVKHVLAVLDALHRGESGGELSVHTVSFLKLLRECELRGDSSYASPEQLRGESLDERSLVFSVGVLLFERLTGRHPFGAENNQRRQLARIEKGEMGSGVNFFPTVPAGLRTVLMRAMGPFPEERFASLADMRARLEQFVYDHEQASPRLPGTSAARPARNDSTRIVRMSTHFGRDLMATTSEHGSDGRRRRERVSQMHLRTVSNRMRTADFDTDTDAETSSAARASIRPAIGLLPENPQNTEQPAAVSEERSSSRDQDSAESSPVSSATEVTASAEPRRSPVTALSSRLVWLGMGAAIAAATMLLFHQRDGATPATAPAAAAASVAAVVTTPDVATEVATVEAFTPRRAATMAAATIEDCFAAERLMAGDRFRVGLRYSSIQGGVTKVYFSTGDETRLQESACIRERLLGLRAGVAPQKTQVINYLFELESGSVHAAML